MMMCVKFLILIFVAQVSIAYLCNYDGEPNFDKKLKGKLMCNYDKYIRPGDTLKTTIVNARMNVKNFDYDDVGNTLSITAWLTLSWEDKRLSWNKDEFSGIESIHMKSDFLWTPDLKVYNAHILSSLGTCHIVDCLITSNSRVACVQPCVFSAHCKDIGFLNWPFDVQNCSFTFGNWMKGGEELNFNEDKVTLVTARIKQNNQWKLLAATKNVKKGKYASSNETFPSISFAFVIERHNGYFTCTLISAALCLIICNLSVFYFTPGNIARILMCGVILIANTLYLGFLYWISPYSGDETPKTMTFFTDMHIITTVILIQSVIFSIVLDNPENPSTWLEKFNETFKTNRFGSILIKSSMEKLPDDISGLMENMRKTPENAYLVYCRILNFISFLAVLITFILMFIALFPKGYLSVNYDPIELLS